MTIKYNLIVKLKLRDHALHPQINIAIHYKVYLVYTFTMHSSWPLHSFVCSATFTCSYNETSSKYAPKLKLAATCLLYNILQIQTLPLLATTRLNLGQINWWKLLNCVLHKVCGNCSAITSMLLRIYGIVPMVWSVAEL